MNDTDNIPGYTRMAPNYRSPWPTNAAARRALITEAAPSTGQSRSDLYDATTGPTPEETVEEAWAEARRGMSALVNGLAWAALLLVAGAVFAWAMTGGRP